MKHILERIREFSLCGEDAVEVSLELELEMGKKTLFGTKTMGRFLRLWGGGVAGEVGVVSWAQGDAGDNKSWWLGVPQWGWWKVR